MFKIRFKKKNKLNFQKISKLLLFFQKKKLLKKEES